MGCFWGFFEVFFIVPALKKKNPAYYNMDQIKDRKMEVLTFFPCFISLFGFGLVWFFE